MKSLSIYVALFIISVAVNPSSNKHKLKVKERIIELNPKTGHLIAEPFCKVLRYKSYYALSFLSVNETLISVGGFGCVWVNDGEVDIQLIKKNY